MPDISVPDPAIMAAHVQYLQLLSKLYLSKENREKALQHLEQ